MDKIAKIKRLIRSSLDIFCGQQLTITDLIVLPTFKFDDTCDEWVVDSHAIFLSIKKTTDPKLTEETYGFGGTFIDQSQRITDFLEGFLGYDVCVDVV